MGASVATTQRHAPSSKTRFDKAFYWPTAMADATEVVRSYEGCQYYAR
jgi:hypothetical protein